MYTLYFFPDACSLATQTLLNELDLPAKLIHKQDADNYKIINPTGMVPTLIDGSRTIREGANILFYLLDKHTNHLLPKDPDKYWQAREDIHFANATMHPAYSRLFFIAGNIEGREKDKAFQAAASDISNLWSTLEERLQHQPFLGGEAPGVADILLAVYSRWGTSFPVNITIGPTPSVMLDKVIALESFQKALQAQERYKTEV